TLPRRGRELHSLGGCPARGGADYCVLVPVKLVTAQGCRARGDASCAPMLCPTASGHPALERRSSALSWAGESRGHAPSHSRRAIFRSYQPRLPPVLVDLVRRSD